jgi:hypothetical protein
LIFRLYLIVCVISAPYRQIRKPNPCLLWKTDKSTSWKTWWKTWICDFKSVSLLQVTQFSSTFLFFPP